MLEAGCVLDGKYKILDQIGRGGMSVVYLAINERANKTWAVKEVRKAPGDDTGLFVSSLMAETELLKRLRHPGLPGIVDILEREGSLYIVMDYIEGNSLEALLKEEGAQPQEKVISWGKQLCEVLGYLHRQEPPVIYRDMKPSNVILRPDGQIALIDFGTARELKEPGGGDDTVCLGTPGYAAPEQWGGCGQTDARTDIYCLGAALYHLVTGHSPSEAPYGLCPIRRWNPGLSAGLEAVLLTCTRRNPRERYQSCEELLYALEHYEEMDIRYRKKQKLRLGGFLTAAALALLTGIGAAAFGIAEQKAANETYQAWMERALFESSKEGRIEACCQAVRLAPGRAEGYLELVNRVFLEPDEDGIVRFTGEEDEVLRKLLNTELSNGQTCETLLWEQEAYAEVAYELGLAYYYYYEEEGSKPYAVKWLKAAAEAPGLSQACRERAGRLGTIAEYYARLGLVDKAGDAAVSYRDYWEDLTALAAGRLVELDNAVTALRTYQELVCLIYTRTRELKEAGVERRELEGQLANVREHLRTDFADVDWEKLGLETMREGLDVYLADAGRQVEAAFGMPEESE